MLQKSQLVAALDKYDTHGGGRKRIDFYRWLEKQEDWKNKDFGTICKCLEDCIDDEWIGTKMEREIDDAAIAHRNFMVEASPEYPMRDVEYIFVRSRGREITKWKYFIPAVLEKMSLMQLTYFAVTTAIALGLAYFGIHGV